jgi:hypothetical protein
MMMTFEFQWGMHSNIPDILHGKTLTLPHGTKLYYENGSWKVTSRITFDDVEGPDPLKTSVQLVTEDIFWFQVNLKNDLEEPPFLVVNPNSLTYKNIADGREMIMWSIPMPLFGKPLAQEDFADAETRNIVNKFSKSSPLKEDTLKMAELPIYYLSKALEENYADRKAYRFLNLIICLESIVAGSYSTTERICRRTAILIASDFPRSQEIFESLKKMYNLRNKIFHGGVFPNVEDRVIKELFNFVRLALRNYLILLGKSDNPDKVRTALDRFLDSSAIEDIRNTIKKALE